MKKRHQAEGIIRILRDVQSSEVKSEAIKRHGISQQTYYAWKRKYGGMQVDASKISESS